MTRNDVNRLFRELLDRDVRFLVVGGLAVVAHGHVRMTADVDLLMELGQENVAAFADAIKECGYSPRAPVQVHELAVPAVRQRWIHEKGMAALSFWSTQAPLTELDVLFDAPIDYHEALEQAVSMEVEPGLAVPFIGLQHLLTMKRAAGRPKDLADVAALENLHGDDHE